MPHRARRISLLIAALWLVQFAIFYAAPAAILGFSDSLDFSWTTDLLDKDHAPLGLLIATFVSAVQGAFLLPIAQPRLKTNPAPSLVRLVLMAFCLAAVLAGAATYILAELAETRAVNFGEDYLVAAFWATTFALGVPGFAFMSWRFRRGIPIVISMLMAALMAGVLLAGLIMAAFALVRLVSGTGTPSWAWYWILIPSPLVSWAIFTPLIIAFVRKGRPETRLAKLAAALLIGSTIEAVAVLPLHVMIRKRTSCYCEEASYWSLVASMSVGLVTFGPAVYLLVWKRHQLRIAEGHCRACGYDMQGNLKADRCPECGAGWLQAPTTSAA
jgi:hypothetical protein